MKRHNMLMVGLMLVEVALIGLFGYGMYRWTFEWRLNGTRVPAEVLAVRADGGDFFVTYSYRAGVQTYPHEHRVGESYFEQVAVGDSIEVIYSPADASISGIPGQGGGDFDLDHLPSTPFNLAFLVFVLPVLIVGVLAVMIVLRVVVRRRRGA